MLEKGPGGNSMVAELTKQNADEIKHKDFCVDEFNTNELQTEKKTRAKSDLTAKIEDLESTIDALTKAIDTLKSEIAEMQVQMKRAGEDREKQNKDQMPQGESKYKHLISWSAELHATTSGRPPV